MDRFRDPVSTMVHTLKPTRRRLQKSDPKTKSLALKRSSQDSNASSIESGLRCVTRQMGSVGPPTIPVPPDLSDSKWLDYVEQSDFKSPVLSPVPSPCESYPRVPEYSPPPPPPAPLFPEFSHLATSDTPTPRPPPDVSATHNPTNRHSTMSIMRRQAKTPVFMVGQLEKSALKRRQAEAAAAANKAAAEEAAAEKPCSVELIAEQYRALLESRDAEEADSDGTVTPSDPPSTPPAFIEPQYQYHYGTEHDMGHRPSVQLELPPRSNHNDLSPTSDDGTLVAFEEDAIYFKPVSFSSPEPSPPAHRQSFDRNARNSSSSTSSNGLQRTMELLTRELSSTMGTNDASSLQIWVMIEAYERLRDQVAEMGLDDTERQNVQGVFDSWLGALNKVHKTMADTAADNESVYDV